MGSEYMHRKRGNDAAPKKAAAPQPSMDALRAGTAKPTQEQMGHRVDLPDAMRAKMENAFGADLSAVKLYESEAVADAGAKAISQGSSIAFAPGMLDFTSFGGQALLGHELSHVVSQARGEVTGGGFLNDHALEARADREGAMAARGEQVAMPTAAMSTVTADAAAGPMQAKDKDKGQKSKLGSRAELDAISPATTVAAMDAAYEGAGGSKTSTSSTAYSAAMQASGLRTNTTDLAKALKTYEGGAFEDVAAKTTAAMAGQNERWANIHNTKSSNADTGAFGGMNFAYSPEISAAAGELMSQVFMPAAGSKDVQDYVRAQHDQIKDAKVFQNSENGTAMDAVMGNLFNRQFGLGAFGQAKIDAGGSFSDAGRGVSDVNSFITRLPNLVRDADTGALRDDQIPEHMRPVFEQYRQMRTMLSPSAPAAPAQQQGGPAPASAPGRKTSDETFGYRTAQVPADWDPTTATDDQNLSAVYQHILHPSPTDTPEDISARKRFFAEQRAAQMDAEWRRTQQPAAQPEKKPGFFKRMFGRKK
ncbi:MAG: DUF4157 domain-containing protein [Ruminococcaceae bacterium]|nr:DUF4157 domain-containing protein [Oscillospiraceae bacterium]